MRGGQTENAILAASKALASGRIDLVATLTAFEDVLLDQALRQSGGNRTRAAELLGISRTTFVDKIKRLEKND